MSEKKVIITGVTAGGKSSLAYGLAQKIGAEIISIDSMKVYKKMDIGTAKPPQERRDVVKYHLTDVVEPWEEFGVSSFLELKDKALEDIYSRNNRVIGVGGTAMYLKNMLYGLFDGPGTSNQLRDKLRKKLETEGKQAFHQQLSRIDPQAADKIHPNDTKRLIRAMEVYELTGRPISSFQVHFNSSPDPSWIVIGIRREKELESRRINARVKRMIETGLVEEAEMLYSLDKPLSKQASAAIGYAELFEVFKGNMELEKAVEQIKINTRKFAKSQRTWFKNFHNIKWINAGQDESEVSILDRAMKILQQEGGLDDG
ncbi:tRNA (adenosine(37)-N6)-dimethylallyltransferase MiaA [Sedimentisphaera salicampi]|uniref:tRNA (adenosine(37)-N6)-dimethylallyltransferase MiaA n=1 Tax=Sedimentisphaera salicampi TaxID=1941349 RepID=UPI000B9CF1ED|nr:tRNA (adenosine(37)-N6)-dimethylallyltransferase MiaA [Sedimentisphaera salicampi]OXU14439.1 tRNA dimethylallyltransferase [Sedimentisphaera salicampi]